MTLTPVESSHIAAVGHDAETETLEVQFVNADVYRYENFPVVVYMLLIGSKSIGSYFSSVVGPNHSGICIHTGALAERAGIWLRSKTAQQYAGNWVALAMGSPVRVIGYAETEEAARAAAGEGGGEFVVVEVPNV